MSESVERQLYSFEDLRDLGFVSNRVTTWRHVKEGRFPAPIKIGRSLRWSRADVDSWLRSRIAERDGRK